MMTPDEAKTTRSKIRGLQELAQILEPLRAGGRKLVHCHGVFDLLHIGHIRHFEQAKRMGDVLIVTVTADKYVNRGPDRPAFPEELRSQAIAALQCVDYVAINGSPTAVEAIRLLRPHVYAKGSDYADAARDRTGGITLEEAAVQAVGGQLVFTNDIAFSSSNLINRHFPVFPTGVGDYLAAVAERYPVGDVLHYLESAQSLRVLVIGEAIVDEYQYCEAIGKASKEAMLVVKRLSMEKFAGGILAVGNHVANFCDEVGLITFLGTEDSQEEFIRENLNGKIEATFLYRRNAPTITKRRFVEKYCSVKLLEIDEMEDGALDAVENEMLCDALNRHVPEYDVVIVVDFGHGMLSARAIEIICEKARFLAVNAQANAGNLGCHTISRYCRADYVCMAENEIRLEARDRRGDLRGMILGVAERLGSRRVVVTRGKYGSLCYSADEGFCEVPALARHVVDRMGAGDAFLAVTALCVARKAPMEVVGFIGNAVGAQAVATVGNSAAVERGPLFKYIETLLK